MSFERISSATTPAHNQDYLQATIALTHGAILSTPPDQLAKRFNEDPEFQKTFIAAIHFTPPLPIQVPMAHKIMPLLSPELYPEWIVQAKEIISSSSLIRWQQEKEFLLQCAQGSTLIVPQGWNLANVRDREGRTALHLVLLNPSATLDMLKLIISACPQLFFSNDFQQKYPSDLTYSTSPQAELLLKSILSLPSNSASLAGLPGMPALLYYFGNMKAEESRSGLKWLEQALKHYEPVSMDELFLLKDPLAELARSGNYAYAKEAALQINDRVLLPSTAVMYFLLPEMLQEKENMTYGQLPINSYRVTGLWDRLLWQSFIQLPMMAGMPGSGLVYMYNLRVWLSVNVPVFSRIYQEYPNSNHELLSNLLIVCPEDNVEACKFIGKCLREMLPRQQCFNIIINYLRIADGNNPPPKAKMLSLIGDCLFDTLFSDMGFLIGDCNDFVGFGELENNILVLARILNPNQFMQIAKKIANHESLSTLWKRHCQFNLFRRWIALRSISPELCAWVLQVFEGYQKEPLDDHRDFFSVTEIFISNITDIKDCVVLETLVKKLGSRSTTRLWIHLCAKIREHLNLIEETNIKTISPCDEMCALILFQAQRNISREKLRDIQETFPEKGVHFYRIVCSKFVDFEFVELLVNELIPNEFLIVLIEEIKRRPFDYQRKLYEAMANRAIEFSSDHFVINTFVIERLLSNDFFLLSETSFLPKAERVEMLNSVLDRFEFKPTMYSPQSLEQFQRLVDYGLNLERLLSSNSLYTLLTLVEQFPSNPPPEMKDFIPFVSFVVMLVGRVALDERSPFNSDSLFLTTILRMLYQDTLNKLQMDQNRLKTYSSKQHQGFCYEIEAEDKTKLITIHFIETKKLPTKQTIFHGYISYEKILETMEKNDHSKLLDDSLEKAIRPDSTYVWSSKHDFQNFKLQFDLVEHRKSIGIMRIRDRVQVIYLKPGAGLSDIERIEFPLETLLTDPQKVEKIHSEWSQKVADLHIRLKAKVPGYCFTEKDDPEEDPNRRIYLLLDTRIGQINCRARDSLGTWNNEWKSFDEAVKWFDEHKWIAETGGVELQQQAALFSAAVPHILPLLKRVSWVLLSRNLGGTWLLAEEPVSNQLLCSTLFDRSQAESAANRLLEIRETLQGCVLNQETVNTYIKPSTKKLHQTPAAVPLSKFTTWFKERKKRDYYQQRSAKEKISIESLETNLRSFINCATTKTGIGGWEDPVKYSQNYLDLEIYLTHTYQELLNRNDEQSLDQFVFDLAVYGVHCGNKLAEVCFQHYGITFGINNLEMKGDDLDSVISSSYRNSFIETIDILIRYLETPTSMAQSIHVRSYLRLQLQAMGYQLPDDPNLTPEQQNPRNDHWVTGWGGTDYPKELLQIFFPAICLPIFIQKIYEAQLDFIREQKWELLGALKLELASRIEMGLQLAAKNSLAINPTYTTEYAQRVTERQDSIREAKEAVEVVEKKLRQLGNSQGGFIGDASQIEGWLGTLTTKIHDLGNECIDWLKQKQQTEKLLKDKGADDAVEASIKGKRKYSLIQSNERDMLSCRLEAIKAQHEKAERSLNELLAERLALQNLLSETLGHVEVLCRRDKLLKELEEKNKILNNVLADRCAIGRIIEEIQGAYLYEPMDGDGISVLNLKGIVQVLMNKSVLV